MTNEDEPTVWEDVRPEEEFNLLHQTGGRNVVINMLRAAGYYGDDPTLLDTTEMLLYPFQDALITDYADLVLETCLNHTQADVSTTGVPLLNYVNILNVQGLCYQQGLANFHDMTMPTPGNNTALMTRFYYLARDMLIGEHPHEHVFLDESGDPVDIDTLFENLDWADTLGVGTHQHEWINRWVIALAIYFRPMMPKFNERFENMDDAQISRVVYTFLIACFFLIADFFMIACMQSDRAVLNMAFLDNGMVNPKVPNSLATVIDPIWWEVAKRGKAAFTVDTGITPYTTVFPNLALINGTDLDNSIKEYELNYQVVDLALKMARQMFGIGKYTDNGKEVHFCTLLDLTGGIDTTVLDTWADLAGSTHAHTRWTVGYGTRMAQQYFEYSPTRAENWKKMLKNRQHWTYTDIAKWADSLFVQFTFQKSINGCAENESYKGLRSSVNFLDVTGGARTDSIFSDPWELIDNAGTALNYNSHEAGVNDKVPMSLYAASLLSGVDIEEVTNLDGIIVNQKLTDTARAFWLRWGMLLDRSETADTGEDDMYRIHMHQIYLTEWVDSRDWKMIGLFNSTDEQIRCENISNWSDYASTIDQYGLSMYRVMPEVNIHQSASRPHGLKGSNGIKCPRTGRSLKKWESFQRLIFGAATATQKATTTTSIPDAGPTVPSSKVDEAPAG